MKTLLQKIICFFRGHKVFPLAIGLHVVLKSNEENTINSVCRKCKSPIKIKMKNSEGRIEYEVE